MGKTTQELARYLGRRLRRHLEQHGLSQKDLAKALDLSTATVSVMLNYRDGGLRVDTAEKIADLLKVHMADLVVAARAAAEYGDDADDQRLEAIGRVAGLVHPTVVERLRTEPPTTPLLWISRAVQHQLEVQVTPPASSRAPRLLPAAGAANDLREEITAIKRKGKRGKVA